MNDDARTVEDAEQSESESVRCIWLLLTNDCNDQNNAPNVITKVPNGAWRRIGPDRAPCSLNRRFVNILRDRLAFATLEQHAMRLWRAGVTTHRDVSPARDRAVTIVHEDRGGAVGAGEVASSTSTSERQLGSPSSFRRFPARTPDVSHAWPCLVNTDTVGVWARRLAKLSGECCIHSRSR